MVNEEKIEDSGDGAMEAVENNNIKDIEEKAEISVPVPVD